MYASPTGSDSGMCTRVDACSTTRVLTVASMAPVKPIVRLLPGIYTTPFELTTAATLSVVATGATLGSSSSLKVSNGGYLNIRGIAVRVANKQVLCGGTSGPQSGLSLEDSTFALVNTPMNNLGGQNCDLKLLRSELTLDRSIGSVLIGTFANTSLQADRVRFEVIHPLPNDAGSISIFGTGATYRITNSVFEDVNLALNTSDTTTPGSQLYFAYNTFVFHSDATNGPLQAGPSAPSAFRDIRFENNILSTLGGSSDTFSRATNCTLQSNIMFPQTTIVGAGNLVADPQLVDAANGDYHPKPTSPAVNAAMPSVGLSTDHDFDGKPRPQGAQPDIGAFELAP